MENKPINDNDEKAKKIVEDPNKKDIKSKKTEDLIDFIKTTAIAIIVMLLVRHFIIQPFYVRGSSMEPNFYEKEYLIVDEISYRFKKIERGDIVVFKLKTGNYNEYLIKRVIGLPGEIVTVKDGKVTIKNKDNEFGFVLTENYLPEGLQTSGDIEEIIPEGSYFVLGDNRGASFDSRYFGAIKENVIAGKVLFRGWPINKMGIVKMGRY